MRAEGQACPVQQLSPWSLAHHLMWLSLCLGETCLLVTCMNLGPLQTWVQEVTSDVGGRASTWMRGILHSEGRLPRGRHDRLTLQGCFKVFQGKVVDIVGRESMGRHKEARRGPAK